MKVNEIKEEVSVGYGKDLKIGMMVYVDDISTVGDADDIRKGIRNCAEMERKKKFIYGMEKTRYMVIKTGKGKEEEVDEEVKKGKVQKIDKYKYMGIMVNKQGSLKDHINYKKSKMIGITSSIKQIGSEKEVGGEWLRIQLMLYETCLIPSLIYALEGWYIISEREVEEFEKIQAKQLKMILRMPKSTSYSGILMETGVWPIREKIEYGILTLYHNLMNSDVDRLVKLAVMEQRDERIERSFYAKVEKIAESLDVSLENMHEMSVMKWKKICREKLKNKAESRIKNIAKGSKQLRFILNDKFEKKNISH